MYMKKGILALLAFGMTALSISADKKMDQFIDNLMSKMTLEEKIGQLNLPACPDITTGQVYESNIGKDIAEGRVGGLFNMKGCEKVRELQKTAVEKSRLGIPLIFGMDVIHGYETVFPIPLAQACSWDLEGIRQAAHVAAREASSAGICWTFSPMVDICRDPRWGRIAEGAGEDPYLAGLVGAAMVKGYQGDSMKANDEIMACVKHFALYGASEAGRDYNTVDMSRVRMFNEYLPTYKACADAGAGSFMSSFNVIDGVPASANKWLMTDVLRDLWGFEGFVVSDYDAIKEISRHGLGSEKRSAERAIDAGVDMDMADYLYPKYLPELVKEGTVSEKDIDRSVRRVLEAKYKLGLFEDPYKYIDPKREAEEVYSLTNREIARAFAPETFVLLKNEGSLLPLQPKGKVALVGPLADAASHMAGMWSVAADASKYRSLRQAFEDALKGTGAQLLYAKGSNLYESPVTEKGVSAGHNIRDPRSEEELLEEALSMAGQADVIVAALGEGIDESGESSSRSSLTLPDTQMRLLKALLATGKPIVMLNFSGRPTVMTYEAENVPAILNVWQAGSESGDAIADVVFGKATPSGKLVNTMPQNVGQIPIYYNNVPTARPRSEKPGPFQKYRSDYVDGPVNPLYPFGYGLTYTTFEYGKPSINSSEMTTAGKVTITVPVTNTGNRTGDEIVQLYIHDLEAEITRPLKELKGFQRVRIEPGQTANVSFTVTPSMLGYYNAEGHTVLEPGDFDIYVGPDSATKNKVTLTLKQE